MKKVPTKQNNNDKAPRLRKNNSKKPPVVATILLSRFDWNESYGDANNKSKPISLTVSASADDWKDFYYYLESGAPSLLDFSCYPQLIHEVECICIENRIIGTHAVDARKTIARSADELKKFVAVVYAFVAHWKEKEEDPINWPDEYKELLKVAKGTRCGLRTIVFKYCLAKGKLNDSRKQKSFEYQFIDRERAYLEYVKNIAEHFAKEHSGRFPSLEALSNIVEDRTVLSFPK